MSCSNSNIARSEWIADGNEWKFVCCSCKEHFRFQEGREVGEKFICNKCFNMLSKEELE